MALATQKQRYTEAEYLELERQAEYKSEYADGELFAMAGASEEHNLIVTNCVISLGTQLKGKPCKVYANDMRVHIQATGRYTYPDIVVVCGDAEFIDDKRDTLTNPTLIIEVLSDTTEAYDRGDKFGNFRTLPSLQTYVLISQDKPHLELFERQTEGVWQLREYKDSGLAPLAAIGCELSLVEVYDKLEFPAHETDS